MINVVEASTPIAFEAGIKLFREYAESLDFSLSFQNFDDELAIAPVMYGAPKGALLLLEDDGLYLGVGGVRQILNDETCEIKRMYIRPDYQGRGLGKQLMQALLEKASVLGYGTVMLDTLAPKMPAAVALYKSFGFSETEPYNFNPMEGVVYFKKEIMS